MNIFYKSVLSNLRKTPRQARKMFPLLALIFVFAILSASAAPVPAPTQITFTILNTSCGGSANYEFFLNDKSIGMIGGDPNSGCRCDPGLQTFTVNNVAVLADAWNSNGVNILRFTKSAGLPYFSWVSARFDFATGNTRAYYDYNGGDATETSLCNAGYTDNAFNELLTTATKYYRDVDGDGFGDPNNFISDYSPTPADAPAGYVTKGGDCEDTDPTIPSQSPCLAKPFSKTAPGLGFTQELVASLPDGSATSGYGFDSHGNPYTYSFNGNLYKIDLSTTNPGPGGVGTIHPLVNLGPIEYRSGSRTGQAIGTVYNFTQYPDGTVYANSDLGVVQVDLETATATSEPLPGSPWGIVVDPQLNAHGHHNIITAGGQVIDPVDHRYIGNCHINGDGIAIDATGNFIFAAAGFQIYKRTSAPGTDLPEFQAIGNYGGSPDGMAFGVVGADQVVVSNDGYAKTVTMWKFPDNDFTKAPTPTIIASEPTSNEYGDQANVGPDGYFYITYWNGTRFPDGSTTGNASVVRFGPAGRFLPPTHSDNLSLTPATDTKTVGSSVVLTATLATTDLSTNQTVPLANTSVTFKVVAGPENGQSFTGTTDANGKVTYTLVNQNGAGDDVVHAQFVDGNNNTQTSNNALITFEKPKCTVPTFVSSQGNQTANTSANSCDNTVTYSSTESVTGSPAPTITYEFTGATTGSGNGNGSGSLFNKGITTVTLTATNSCGSATSTFTVTVTDNVNPTITAPAAVSVSSDEAKCTTAQANVTLGTPTTADNCVVKSVTNDAPATFPLGNTTVTWTVTDDAGNTATASQIVTVTDNIRPIITAPIATTGTTNTGCTSTNVALGTPTTGDNCHVASVKNDAPAAFRIGETTVTWTVTDDAGNTATASQIVTVTDNIRPTISAPMATTGTTNTGCTSTNVALGTPTTGDNCHVASVKNDAPAAFHIGETTVTWTVTDDAGNTATASQIVTVTDNVRPTISAPKATTGTTNTGCTSTNVALGTPTTGDNCHVASVKNDAPAAFPIGETTVTWTVTDDAGNTATASQIVTVTDNIRPTISAPKATTGTTNTGCTSTNVALGTPTTGDNCHVASVKNDAPAAFHIGETTVTWTVTDDAGNTATATQIVTVTDNIRPTITCPGNITVAPASLSGTVVTFATPVGKDNCSVKSVLQISGLSSGSTFPIGTTTVKYEVTDGSGNTANCTFTVTVINPYCDKTPNQEKVYVCHNGNSICISVSALQAHLNHGDYLGACNAAIASSRIEGSLENSSTHIATKGFETVEELTVLATPNPTFNRFKLRITSNDQKTNATIRVVDAFGRSLNQFDKVAIGSTVTFGEGYPSGYYFAEVFQGTQRKVVKLVKGK